MASISADLASSPGRLSAAGAAGGLSGRVVALDGLRGLMTLGVIISHYFGELEHGLHVKVGWIAVDIFFVLSGFLIGKLILEKQRHTNFFKVFYVRRICRIIPAYMITVLSLNALLHYVPATWLDTNQTFPLWSYLTFNQPFFMISTRTIGNHWLAPTWTLAFEEHFYILAPAILVFTPERWLVRLLIVASVTAVLTRIAIYQFGLLNDMAALVLLPARADLIVLGVLGAIAVGRKDIAWERILPALRFIPAICLSFTVLLDWYDVKFFHIYGPLLMAVGGACYIICIYLGTPEADRFKSKTLQFFGNNGYCLYLTHLPVLGVMHGLILGSPPDIATPSQWLVTLSALPVCVLVGWGMTKLIEEPMTTFGRRWRWGKDARMAI